MRSVVYRFHDLDRLDALLDRAERELLVELPEGEDVGEGEWVLAIFEVGVGRRATAAAARGTDAGDGPKLSFELRDFQRVREFVAAARRSSQSGTMRAHDRTTDPPATIRTQTPHIEPSTPGPSGVYDSGKFPARIGAGSRVLLIDDDPDIREIVGAMLEAVGLVVESCACAEDALSESAKTEYDLLVVDWNLPGMNGLELCRSIRKSARTAKIPVLFLSANASSHDMVEAFASGADDYVVKPFRAPELGARIFGLLRRARMAGHGPARVVP